MVESLSQTSLSATRKRWFVAPVMNEAARQYLSEYPRPLQQVLYNRGVRSAEEASEYLRGEYREASDPFLLSGMREAVERIHLAIIRHERIAVYGDYDVDGVTATALLTQVLVSLGADMIPYIPNRFEEGYGLNVQAVHELKERGVCVVVTVDCGIRSSIEAKLARELGLDLIITDHHEPGDEIPNAFAVINPKQPDDLYPEKYLAGVGIAYKLAVALMSLFPVEAALPEEDLLDLVALGTVADVAPLKGENRSLVRRGMRQLRSPRRPGIIELTRISSVNPSRLTSTDIGFRLGPRLNAAGRIQSAWAAYELLVSNDHNQIEQLANLLNEQNEERQNMTRSMHKTGVAIVETLPALPSVIFVVQPDFNHGVVGLVASRLVESFYRPSIVGRQEDGVIRASCRSIKGFDIHAALEQCSDLLLRFGGHAMAAGITIQTDMVPAFIQRMNQIAAEVLKPEDLIKTIAVDAAIPLSEATMELVKKMDLMQPTGAEAPPALWMTRNCQVISARAVGKEEAHLKLYLGDGTARVNAIAFGFGHLLSEGPLEKVDVVYTVDINEYNGNVSVQLMVEDIRRTC